MQHYSHIAAFALAFELSANIVLPPAVTRETFGKTYNQVQWTTVPTATMLDVDQIVAKWRQHGMLVHKVNSTPAPTTTCIISFLTREGKFKPALARRRENNQTQADYHK